MEVQETHAVNEPSTAPDAYAVAVQDKSALEPEPIEEPDAPPDPGPLMSLEVFAASAGLSIPEQVALGYDMHKQGRDASDHHPATDWRQWWDEAKNRPVTT